MAVAVADLVAFEVFDVVDGLDGVFPAGWDRAMVAMVGMEMIIDVAVEAFGAVEPGADADEDASGEPLGAVVAVRSAVVGSDVIVTVGAYRRNANVDADGYLSLCFGSGYHKADCN
jgi:hypothetical protein